MSPTAETEEAMRALATYRHEIEVLLARYEARNLRVFGSVARGEATEGSDIDLLVDLDHPQHRTLMRLGGLNEGMRRILGRPVDVVTPSVLRGGVSKTAAEEAVVL